MIEIEELRRVFRDAQREGRDAGMHWTDADDAALLAVAEWARQRALEEGARRAHTARVNGYQQGLMDGRERALREAAEECNRHGSLYAAHRIRALAAQPGSERELEDGFGNMWQKCGLADCGLNIVRPGKVQCDHERCPNVAAEPGAQEGKP